MDVALQRFEGLNRSRGAREECALDDQALR
jgi:hypothetical protein